MDGTRTKPAADGIEHVLSFRACVEKDIPACARLAREAWPAGPGVASKEIELAGMEGYMQYSLDSSNWTDIACTDEGMVGFLFGRIEGLPGPPAPDRGVLGELPSLLASILDHDRRDARMLAFLWSLALTEFKLRVNTPASDASVEMFIVGSEWRGKGVGTLLLDRFLDAAKGAGCRRVTLYTDELMSNWRFYENRGFRKVATFHDNITSHYSGLPAVGIVFAKDILERDGA
jgi:GNAT superfamily N-acetyltransferase